MHRILLGLAVLCLAVPAARGEPMPSYPAAEYAAPRQDRAFFGWFFPDEARQRRKDFCLFAFGTADRYLHPNRYRPLPPLPLLPPPPAKPQIVPPQ